MEPIEWKATQFGTIGIVELDGPVSTGHVAPNP